MNLMQYLSVGGALEAPREKKFSRRIGNKDGEASEADRSKTIVLVDPSHTNSDQGEFGFIEPLEIDRSSSSSCNHLELNSEESEPQSSYQLSVESRITPSRVRVVRNDLVSSDIAFRSSLIAEEPKRTPFFTRLRNRFSLLDQIIRLLGITKISTTSVGRVSFKDDFEQTEEMKNDEFHDAIELAKDYKTDVYINGQVAWRYSEYSEKLKV